MATIIKEDEKRIRVTLMNIKNASFIGGDCGYVVKPYVDCPDDDQL